MDRIITRKQVGKAGITHKISMKIEVVKAV